MRLSKLTNLSDSRFEQRVRRFIAMLDSVRSWLNVHFSERNLLVRHAYPHVVEVFGALLQKGGKTALSRLQRWTAGRARLTKG